MTDEDAFAFHIRIRQCRLLPECLTAFGDAIAPFGFTTFGCGELDLRDRSRSAFYLLAWPEDWRKFYMASGFINQDPIVGALQDRQAPFTWSDLRADRKMAAAGRAALDRAAAAGWREGLVVPLPQGGNRVGLVSMVGHASDLPPSAVAYLSLISICLHTHVRTLVADQGFAVPPAALTAREVECLKLAARGLSDAAIGQQLGIAQSTAHEFIEKAKRRFQTRSRTELVAIAVALGIVAI